MVLLLMAQIKGIFGLVIYWGFAKSIRIQVFIWSHFSATGWLKA
jgi:hypothetical protein